jgi:hypothetical protein
MRHERSDEAAPLPGNGSSPISRLDRVAEYRAANTRRLVGGRDHISTGSLRTQSEIQ